MVGKLCADKTESYKTQRDIATVAYVLKCILLASSTDWSVSPPSALAQLIKCAKDKGGRRHRRARTMTWSAICEIGAGVDWSKLDAFTIHR